MVLDLLPRREIVADPGTFHTVLSSARLRMPLRERSRVVLAARTAATNAPRMLSYGSASLSQSFANRRVEIHDPIVRGRLAKPIAMDLLLRAMLRHFRAASPLTLSFGLRMGIVMVPQLSETDRADYLEIVQEAARVTAEPIEAPFAAARGCGLDVWGHEAHMLVDIGAGKSYAAILSLGGVVSLATADFGSADWDAAIQRHVERRHHIVLPLENAEGVKCSIGSVFPKAQPESVGAIGVDNRTGFEKKIMLDDNEIRDVLIDAGEPLMGAIHRCLAEMPAQLAAEIDQRGMTLVGGGALLYGLPDFLSERLGLRCQTAGDPLNATIRGAQELLLSRGRE